MSISYMPSADADFDLWQLNLTTKVVLSPGTYGLDTSYSAALSPMSADFHTKLGIANTQSTRTPVSIASKDAARAALKSFIRVGVNIIQATPAVTNEAKEALNIPIHSNTPTPIPAPSTYPVIDATPSGPRLTQIKISDSATPDSRKKPSGAVAMALFAKASATPISDPEQLDFIGMMSRNALQQQWPVDDLNKTMYIAGVWITRTGKRGPWSSIAATGVAA